MIQSKKNLTPTKANIFHTEIYEDENECKKNKLIFISWSQPKSKKLAHELRRIILDCFEYGVDVFISDMDIKMGDDWRDTLHETLKDTDLGIIALTDENNNKPWLMYEAGSVAQQAPIIPIFYGRKQAESPLKSHQSVLDFNKKNLSHMLKSISDHLGFRIGSKHFHNYIDNEWKNIKTRFLSIVEQDDKLPGSYLSVEDLKNIAIEFANDGYNADIAIGINYGGSIMAPTYIYKKKDKPSIQIIHFKKNGKKPSQIGKSKVQSKNKEIVLLDAKYKSGETIIQALKSIKGYKSVNICVGILYVFKADKNPDKTKYKKLKKNIYYAKPSLGKGENTNLNINYKYKIKFKNLKEYKKALTEDDPIKEELFQYLKG